MAVTALIFVFLRLAAAPLYAQQSATLQGHVLDALGGTVAGAAITLRRRLVDFDASVQTDSEGRYVIAEIPAGTYTLEVAAAGLRPEVIEVLVLEVGRSVDQWFDTSVFAAVDRFGNLGRNVVIGPAFHDTDLSILKNIRRDRRVGLQFRADIFDLFNHANFGPPGNIVGSPTFGKITRTRFSTGEAGSARQIQLAVKAWF